MRNVRKCDFDFLTEWFYPVFRKTIFTGQFFDIYWLVNRSTGQYPILAYTTWRDLNQSQPHISIRGITIYIGTCGKLKQSLGLNRIRKQ